MSWLKVKQHKFFLFMAQFSIGWIVHDISSQALLTTTTIFQKDMANNLLSLYHWITHGKLELKNPRTTTDLGDIG